MTDRLKASEVQRLFLYEVARMLDPLGFSHRKRTYAYTKPFNLGRHTLFLNLGDNVDYFSVAGSPSLRFDAVEEILHDAGVYGGSVKRRDTSSMGVEMGNLSRGRRMEWNVLEVSDVEPVATELVEAFKTIGLPYLERYSDLRTAFKAMKRTSREAWLHMPFHDYRAMTAIAMALVLGEHDQIEPLIEKQDAYLHKLKDPMIDVHFKPFCEFIRERLRQER